MSEIQKTRGKALLLLVYLSLGLNLLTSPIAYFIGGMATDPPDSTVLDFLKGFLFIQAIPLFILFIFTAWYFIYKNRYVYVGITFLCAVILGSTIYVWIHDTYKDTTNKVFLIPNDYKGCVGVFYNFNDEPPLKIEDKKIIYRLTEDGVLKTSSNGNFGKANERDTGWHNVKFYYVDKNGNQVQQLKVGKDIHNVGELGESGLDYLQFFVGTNKEAEKHSKFSSCFSKEQLLQISHK